MSLKQIIIDRIKKEGPVSFRDFMEMALYYPNLGYYTSAHETFGKKGDYFTSPAVTPAFGAMIGRQLEEMWHSCGEDQFTIVEYGAGTGMLCHDILNYLKNSPQFYQKLNYCIIEKSAALRERQQQHLHEKVEWHETIAELGEITGCVLSNELVDNFAVHQVMMEEDLMEIFVDHEAEFREILNPANPELKDYLNFLKVQLPKGFRTEINLEAIAWIREIALSLKNGFVITIDYGGTSAELYGPRKSRGTLLCYNKHSINEQPYLDIGSQDITAHVNFSALSYWGNEHGLDTCGLTDQANFLLSLGFKEYLRQTLPVDNDIMKMVKKESFITHMMLVEMGHKFKVLVQKKGITECRLSGLALMEGRL